MVASVFIFNDNHQHTLPAYFFLGIAQFVLTMIVLYLYMKTPRNLQDQLLFHWEFKYSAVVFAVGLFSMIVPFIVDFVVNGNFYVVFTLMSCIGVIRHATPSLLSTLVIPYKVNTMAEWNGGARTLRIETKESSGSFDQKLREILNDEKNCEAFVDWMYREFCSEAILSFLECVQFRKYVEEEIGKMNGSGLVGGDSESFNFTLYEGMPISSIVYDSFSLGQDGKNEVTLSSSSSVSSVRHLVSSCSPMEKVLERCKKIAHLLFNKYIDHAAPHEINISSRLRAKYVDLEESDYDGVKLEQFLTLYDDVISEMMKYQAQSYRRYEIRTPR